MDITRSPTEADPLHDGDVVLLAPNDLASAVEAVSRLAYEVARDASDQRTSIAEPKSFGLQVTAPAADKTLHSGAVKNDEVPSNPLPLGRRAVRMFANFMLAVCIGVGGTLVWQGQGDAAKQIIASWVPQLGSSPSLLVSLASPDPNMTAKPRPAAIEVAATDAAAARRAALAHTGPDTDPLTGLAAPSSELVHQQVVARDLATLGQSVEQLIATQEKMARDIAARDLAILRQSVEQLTASQEKMASDIAKLQAAEQDIRRKLATPPPRAAAASARKLVSTPPLTRPAPPLSLVRTRP